MPRRTDRPNGRFGPASRHRGRAAATGLRAVLATALIVAALAACTPRTQSSVGTTTVRITGTCDSSRVVEVGATLPLSGTSAAMAREYLTGLELAVDHVNHAGGVLGNNRCLELLYKDDRGDPAVAARAVSDLLNDESVTYLVGPLLREQIRGAGAMLTRAGVPTSGFSGIDATFRRVRYPWMFPVASSNATVAAKMAQYAAAQSWSRLGVVSPPGADGDRSFGDFTRAAQRLGLRVVGHVAVSPAHDASRAVEALRTDGAQDLVILDDSPSVANVLAARTQLGWAAPVVSTATAADASVVARLTRPALHDVAAVVPQPLVGTPDSSVAAIRSFRDAVQRRIRASLLDGSILAFAQGYDAITMLAATANSTHSTSATSLRTYLESAGFQGLLASYSYSTAAHAGITADQLTVVPVDSLLNGIFIQPAGGAPTAG